MRKILTTILFGASLLGLGCADKINGPKTSSQSYVSNASFYRYFDTKDVPLNQVESQIAELSGAFPYLDINPKTQELQGEKYVLGFSLYGQTSTEITNTDGKVTEKPLRLAPNLDGIGKRLDQIVGGENYQRLPDEAFDYVDVPETPELVERIKERQQKARIGNFNLLEVELFYLKDASGNIVHSPQGEKMINGILARSNRLDQTGYQRGEAAYIITGNRSHIEPKFFWQDSLGNWIPVDTLKFSYINADSAKKLLQENEQSMLNLNLRIKDLEKIKGRPLRIDEILDLMNKSPRKLKESLYMP